MTYSVAEVDSQRRVNDGTCSDCHPESLASATYRDSWCSFAVALPFVCGKAFLSFSLAAKPVRTHSIRGIISWDRVGEVYMTKSWPLFVLVSVR
jgi:hypothetical protein